MPALLCPGSVNHVSTLDASPVPSTPEIVKHAPLPAVSPVPWQGPRSSVLPGSDQSRSLAVQHLNFPVPAPVLRASRAIRATQLDYSPDRLPSAPRWNNSPSAVGCIFSRFVSSAVEL